MEVGSSTVDGYDVELTCIRLSCTPADLGYEQVNAKGCVLVFEVLLYLINGILEHLGRLADAAYNADATWMKDSNERALE
jgi:hypothetical protein